MAPEIVKREQGFSMASDWWAVGVIAYELLMGTKPFKDKKNIAKDRVIFPNAVKIPHSDSFRDLVNKLLEKRPMFRLG